MVHPKAVEVMNEVGIDLSKNYPKNVDQFLERPFSYVITVCDNARETCPVFSGKVVQNLHIGFDDPPKLALDASNDDERMEPYFRVCLEIKKSRTPVKIIID